MESRADRLARIRGHDIFNELIVKPRLPIDGLVNARNTLLSTQPEETLRQRPFGRFNVLAHMTALFSVNHEHERLKLLVDLFAEGLTGIDRILWAGKGNAIRLWIYIAVFVILTVAMMYLITLAIIEYLQYKTIVTVSLLTGEARVLPAVTICSLNPFKNDKLCNPNDTHYSEREEMCKAESRDNFVLALSRFKNKAAGNATLQSFFNRSLYTWDDIVHSCRYRREFCSPDWIKEVVFSIYRYGRCFCIFCDLLKVAPNIDFANIMSPSDGLDIVLTNDPDNFVRSTNLQGFVIMIHDRFRSPDPNSDGVFVAVGMTTYIGLSMKRVRLLPEPFRSDCHTGWPEGEPYNSFLTKDDMYSEQGCRKICINYYIMKECNCLDLYKGVDYQQMLDSDTICVDEATIPCRRQKVQDPENVTGNCNCPKRCNEVQYMTTTSQMGWNLGLDKTPPTVTWVSHVVLYADRFEVNKIVESQEISFTSALSTIGGFMNMFTGASFLLVYEAVNILMIWGFRVLTMKRPHEMGVLEY